MPIPKYGTVYLVENSDMKLRNVGSVHTTLEDKKSYNGVPREYPSVITDMKYENNREFKALMEYMGKKIEYSGSGFDKPIAWPLQIGGSFKFTAWPERLACRMADP